MFALLPIDPLPLLRISKVAEDFALRRVRCAMPERRHVWHTPAIARVADRCGPGGEKRAGPQAGYFVIQAREGLVAQANGIEFLKTSRLDLAF